MYLSTPSSVMFVATYCTGVMENQINPSGPQNNTTNKDTKMDMTLNTSHQRALRVYNSPKNKLKRWLRDFLGIQKELEMIHKDLSLLMCKQMDMQDAFEKAGWMGAEVKAAVDINKGEMEG
jgi:hypothetical protein